jgi:hypothetical protein
MHMSEALTIEGHHLCSLPTCSLPARPPMHPPARLPHTPPFPLHAASWHHAAFHTVTAVVGAGVLGLAHAFSFLGW